MDRKKEIKEELEQLSPFLANLEKKPDFDVPANYFNDLQDDLWKQVRPTPKVQTETPQKNWLDDLALMLAGLFQPRMALSLASLLLLLTAGWYFLQPTTISSESMVAQADDSLEDVADYYLASHFDEFDSELLMQLELEDEELSQITENSLEEGDGFDPYLDELLNSLETEELIQLL